MPRNYLEEFDAALDSEKQQLVNCWIKEEPLPFFKQLREERPVLETPECVLVSRYQDVCDILQAPDIFTTQLYLDKIYTSPRNPGHFFAHDNDDLHIREKAIIQQVLNRDDLSSIRVLVKENARQIITQAKGNLELIEHYSRKLPALVAQEYFGFHGAGYKELKSWAVSSQLHTFFNHHFNLYDSDKSGAIAKEYTSSSKEMIVYLKKLLLKKWFSISFGDRILAVLGLAKDDVAKRLLRISRATPKDFSLMRVGTNLAGLLAGSVENVSSAVVNSVNFLLTNPEYLVEAKKIAATDDTFAFDNLVWELLRFAPITPYVFRHTAKKTVIAKGKAWETQLPEGKTVLLLTQSAMFDQQIYEDAERFNPQRSHHTPLAFGYGIHECVGKYLGISMISEMLRELVLCEDLKLQKAIDYQEGPFPEVCNITWRKAT